jgi:hypothetical protein
MELAQQKVRETLAHSVSPAVLSSFGKDSMLLLDLVREVIPHPNVIWFRTGVDETFARRIIREWNLTAFSWRPADVYLVCGQQTTMVQEYSVGEHRLPVLVDLVESDQCATCRWPNLRTPTLFLPFDTLLVGWKDTDEHWLKGNAPLATDGFTIGRSKMYAPLRHMTDEAVRAGIIDRKIPFEPTPDELPICIHCLESLPEMPVEEFRQRYELEGA